MELEREKELLEKSVDLYSQWNDFSHESIDVERYFWPFPQGIIGQATGIGYRSTKWDRVEKNFFHEHETPLPHMRVQFFEGRKMNLPKRQFSPSTTTLINLNAELLFIEVKGKNPLSWVDLAKKPKLYWEEQRRLLIVRFNDPQTPVMILHSRDMKITDRGIKH
jgi:hypothetical protein